MHVLTGQLNIKLTKVPVLGINFLSQANTHGLVIG